MSKQTPSQGFNFEVVLDPEKESELQKIKRWIRKQKPPLNTILEYLFSYVEKWYIDAKVEATMQDVDRQAESIVKQWDEEDVQPEPEIVETGVFGDEGWSISISNPVVERRSKESDPSVGTGSDEV
jgi:hypothetical protein